MNRITLAIVSIAVSQVLFHFTAFAQQQGRTLETPLLSYVMSSDSSLVKSMLSEALAGGEQSYYAIERAQSRVRVFRDEEQWLESGDGKYARLPTVRQVGDNASGSDGWIQAGSLFYLSDAQRAWYSNASNTKVAIPDFSIENMASVWTGTCAEVTGGIAQQVGASYSQPKEFLPFFEQVVSASLDASSTSMWRPRALSQRHQGLIVGGTWMERMLSYEKIASMVLGSWKDSNPLETLNPNFRSELRLARLDDFVGDVYFFGRLRGPQPMHAGSVVAYGGTHFGQPQSAPVVMYPGGTFIVYLPCVSLRRVLENPLVLRFQADSQRSYLIPLQVADEARFPSNSVAFGGRYPNRVRTGIRPSSWGDQRGIYPNESGAIAAMLADSSQAISLDSQSVAQSIQQNALVKYSSGNETQKRLIDPGYSELLSFFNDQGL